MNTKTVFDRLQSIDDEVQKLHNTIFALKTTDIQAYADKYEELSISAALRSERIACQLRNLVYTTTDTGKKDYLKQAADVQGIKISFSNSVLSLLSLHFIITAKQTLACNPFISNTRTMFCVDTISLFS